MYFVWMCWDYISAFFYLLLLLCVWAGGKTPLQNFLGIAEQHMGPNNGVSTHIWTLSRETWTAIGAVTVIAVFRDISYLLVLALPRPQLDRLLFGWSGSVWIPTVESAVSTAEAPNCSQILIMFFLICFCCWAPMTHTSQLLLFLYSGSSLASPPCRLCTSSSTHTHTPKKLNLPLSSFGQQIKLVHRQWMYPELVA